MPLYEFECKTCHHRFEESHSISNRKDPEKKPCPKCGQKKVTQEVFSLPGIHSGRGMKKPDSGFREVLQRIKKANPKSNINTF